MKFGPHVRKLREQKGFSLRRFAETIKVSPTYLSKVERGELPPPAEDKIQAIAQELGENEDELLALAGRVATELHEIIREHPREMATFLRAAKSLSPAALRKLTENAARRARNTDRE